MPDLSSADPRGPSNPLIPRAAFVTTRWTLVLNAGRAGTPESRRALETLCGQYWYPLYAFVRQQGYGVDDAGELTQEFFLRLLARNDLAAADPARGRFRSWLLGALKHFLSDERDRANAQKRGGGRPVASIDPIGPDILRDAENRYAAELADHQTPQALFDRRWALALLETVLARLRAEMEGQGRREWFDALKHALGGADDGRPYRETAESLGTSEGAVKVAVHRMRRRYRELLCEEIARTVDDPAEVEAEIRDLFSALG